MLVFSVDFFAPTVVVGGVWVCKFEALFFAWCVVPSDGWSIRTGTPFIPTQQYYGLNILAHWTQVHRRMRISLVQNLSKLTYPLLDPNPILPVFLLPDRNPSVSTDFQSWIEFLGQSLVFLLSLQDLWVPLCCCDSCYHCYHLDCSHHHRQYPFLIVFDYGFRFGFVLGTKEAENHHGYLQTSSYSTSTLMIWIYSTVCVL